ncbi:DTW domain-containing protein [uncultured Gammaproteobacteria bacterium]
MTNMIDTAAASPAVSPATVPPTGVPEPVPTCAACRKPQPLCVCATIEPVATRLAVVVLQHPREQDRELGTATLTHLQLTNSVLKIGLSWSGLKRIIGREVEMRRWAVLYLGTAGQAPEQTDQEVLMVDGQGKAMPDQRRLRAGLEGIILLDGNWEQAKTLWWRNPWLLKAQRMVLNPGFRSRYGNLRRQPRRQGLSTLEAVALCLSRLEGRPELFDHLLKPFDALIERANTLQVAPETAPTAKPARVPRGRGGRRA